MKQRYNIHEAKTQFSALIGEVARGNEIVIARAGEPIAKLVPFRAAPKARKPGSGAGMVTIAENFDDPLPQAILKGFFE